MKIFIISVLFSVLFLFIGCGKVEEIELEIDDPVSFDSAIEEEKISPIIKPASDDLASFQASFENKKDQIYFSVVYVLFENSNFPKGYVIIKHITRRAEKPYEEEMFKIEMAKNPAEYIANVHHPIFFQLSSDEKFNLKFKRSFRTCETMIMAQIRGTTQFPMGYEANVSLPALLEAKERMEGREVGESLNGKNLIKPAGIGNL